MAKIMLNFLKKIWLVFSPVPSYSFQKVAEKQSMYKISALNGKTSCRSGFVEHYETQIHIFQRLSQGHHQGGQLVWAPSSDVPKRGDAPEESPAAIVR